MSVKKQAAKKSIFTGALYARMDIETARALREVMKLTERQQSDALRWSIRQTARNLKAGSVLEART